MRRWGWRGRRGRAVRLDRPQPVRRRRRHGVSAVEERRERQPPAGPRRASGRSVCPPDGLELLGAAQRADGARSRLGGRHRRGAVDDPARRRLLPVLLGQLVRQQRVRDRLRGLLQPHLGLPQDERRGARSWPAPARCWDPAVRSCSPTPPARSGWRTTPGRRRAPATRPAASAGCVWLASLSALTARRWRRRLSAPRTRRWPRSPARPDSQVSLRPHQGARRRRRAARSSSCVPCSRRCGRAAARRCGRRCGWC